MVGYPYDYGNQVEKTIDFHKVTRVVLIATTVGVSMTNPAVAVDAVGQVAAGAAGNGTATNGKKVAVMAALLAADAAACTKTKIYYDQLVDKAAKNPKVVGLIVCAGAAAWCARGVAERVVKAF
jgi:hypothetical protein